MILVAPLQGWSTPLDEAPDAVFAGRMLGDGVAIDPTSPVLHAPCAATVVNVAASKHAVTLRAANGAEILLHVGIDTVGLRGQGFEMHVREGQEVGVGERLISFDLDLLARTAKSVLTPIILTSGGAFTIAERAQDRRVEVGEFLIEAVSASAAGAGFPELTSPGRSSAAHARGIERIVLVRFEHGIHARPGALIAASIRNLAADVRIAAGERTANARSPVALMSLGIQHGDRITISASGADAEAAVAALERIIQDAAATSISTGSRASPMPSGASVPRASSGPLQSPTTEQAGRLAIPGVVANRGLAVGRAWPLRRSDLQVEEAGTDPVRESAGLVRARDAVRERLRRTLAQEEGSTRAIAEAHLEMLDDPELLETSQRLIELGKSAGFGWRSAIRAAMQALRTLPDPRMRERADDLLDLESRVLVELGGHAPPPPELGPESIVLADELLPSELVGLDANKLAGICLARGGPTSHVAIIAAAMGVPMIAAAGERVLHVEAGVPVVLDAESGCLQVAPLPQELDSARDEVMRRRAQDATERAAAQHEGRTADGLRIEVFANVGSATEAQLAVRNGAEGVGLLRTEFLFLERQSAPDLSEQASQYQKIADALQKRPLTIRTLDVGGDKPIAYLPLPPEENPALGLRGIRTSLWRPDLLRVQLQAVLQVQPAGQCRILLPMVTDPGEIRAVRRILDELTGALATAPRVGAMIETPAAALMADRIVREADFLSIGTNDLTQYTLAMDRGQADLAARLDGLHPAVLRLIARAAEAGRGHGRPVAVCGGLASDPTAVPVLLGLGIDELSMVPAVIPAMKALLARLRVAECASLAAEALEQETSEAVRELVRQRLVDVVPWPVGSAR